MAFTGSSYFNRFLCESIIYLNLFTFSGTFSQKKVKYRTDFTTMDRGYVPVQFASL